MADDSRMFFAESEERMTSIARMREALQEPRRHCDTWYGRNVMRKGSIYLTWTFERLGLGPDHASWLSLAAGIVGASFLAGGRIGFGILGINLWYLLDHVDGELARHTGRLSPTGAYLDTVINFFVQPLTFLGFGWGLSAGREDWVFAAGLSGAMGYWMLSAVPMLEDLIVLDALKGKGKREKGKGEEAKVSGGTAKKIFSGWHRILTFPNFLMTVTLFYGISVLTLDEFSRLQAMRALIGFYGFSISFVWAAQLCQKVLTRKADQRVRGA